MNRPSALACIECRKHHLKCNAGKPSCSRCAASQLRCVYLPSRRGGKRRDPGKGRSTTIPENQQQQLEQAPELVPEVPDSVAEQSIQGSPVIKNDQKRLVVPDSRLVRLYYENFHPAHPILVPGSLYDARKYPPYLHQVVRFIGSQYSALIPSNAFYQQTATELTYQVERTPCMVQALLLFSMALYARNESSTAAELFARAVDIALGLGMCQKHFAETVSGGDDREAESLRRTWWEMFILDVNMAVLQQKLNLRCDNIPHDVELPCEESLYGSSAAIPTPPTLSSFRMRFFNSDDDGLQKSRYSSFTYRIDAVCILARVLVLNRLPETHQDHLQAVTNALVSWVNHLPPDKMEVVDKYGNVDEMLFQAHITIHYAAMLLHLPRSNLRPKFPNTGIVVCPSTPFRLSPSLTRHVHDVKAIEASKKLTNLLTVRPTTQGYSPFIVFGLVLCGLIQLAATEIHSSECAEHHSNRIILVLGCLKALWPSWPLAHEAYRCLQTAAEQTLMPRTDSSIQDSSSLQPPQKEKERTPVYDLMPLAEDPGDNTMEEILDPSFLSAYIDPTCSDPFLFG